MFNRAMTAAAVLLLLGACSSHRAANAPAAGAAPSATATSDNAMAGSGTSSPGISQPQAQKMLEQDGYAGVKNLHQSGDGGWTGNATANGKPVTVTVSPAGDVRAQ
jgi:hypothetical protein